MHYLQTIPGGVTPQNQVGLQAAKVRSKRHAPHALLNRQIARRGDAANQVGWNALAERHGEQLQGGCCGAHGVRRLLTQ